jgi:excinuclease ABC subunit C
MDYQIRMNTESINKTIYGSILDTIPKVGKVTKTKLLKKYKTLENIKNASREELKELKISEEAIDNIYLALKQTT